MSVKEMLLEHEQEFSQLMVEHTALTQQLRDLEARMLKKQGQLELLSSMVSNENTA